MIIENGGVALHVEQNGNRDSPVALLLHGITSSTATWDWLIPHLAGNYRVLRLDFRGQGQSGRAPGTYHFPSYLADAIAVCEQAVGRPCVVIGHSLGGGTAAALAQHRPDLVRGILLEDPALARSDQLRGELEGNALLDAFRLMRQMIPLLQESNAPGEIVADTLAGSPGPSGAPLRDLLHADAINAMATSMLQLDATVLDPVLDGSMITAFDPEATISVPATVLAADPASPDAVVRAGDVARLARNSPHVEVRVVAGAGHLIHDSLAHRDTFRDAVLEFLTINAH